MVVLALSPLRHNWRRFGVFFPIRQRYCNTFYLYLESLLPLLTSFIAIILLCILQVQGFLSLLMTPTLRPLGFGIRIHSLK